MDLAVRRPLLSLPNYGLGLTQQRSHFEISFGAKRRGRDLVAAVVAHPADFDLSRVSGDQETALAQCADLPDANHRGGMTSDPVLACVEQLQFLAPEQSPGAR